VSVYNSVSFIYLSFCLSLSPPKNQNPVAYVETDVRLCGLFPGLPGPRNISSPMTTQNPPKWNEN